MVDNKAMPSTRKRQNERALIESATDLAKLMATNPAKIERGLASHGEKLVGIFCDENYTTQRFKNLNHLKIDTLQRAIEDISIGVSALRSSTLGLAVKDSQINHYISPHGVTPEGNVIFSINWKDIKAFKNWRQGNDNDISQDDLNAAIYYLTAEIAKLIDL
jgi:hypothetical protein